MTDKIDTAKEWHGWIMHPDMTMPALKILAHLSIEGTRADKAVPLSLNGLAREIGLHPTQVKRGLAVLEKMGLVQLETSDIAAEEGGGITIVTPFLTLNINLSFFKTQIKSLLTNVRVNGDQAIEEEWLAFIEEWRTHIGAQVPRRGNVSLRQRFATRMKDQDFRDGWRKAVLHYRWSPFPYDNRKGWFSPLYFLSTKGGRENWSKSLVNSRPFGKIPVNFFGRMDSSMPPGLRDNDDWVPDAYAPEKKYTPEELENMPF